MNYKCSVFNYIAQTEKGNIIYNTLYNTLARLSDDELSCYYGDKKCGVELKYLFVDNGLWVEQDLD